VSSGTHPSPRPPCSPSQPHKRCHFSYLSHFEQPSFPGLSKIGCSSHLSASARDVFGGRPFPPGGALEFLQYPVVPVVLFRPLSPKVLLSLPVTFHFSTSQRCRALAPALFHNSEPSLPQSLVPRTHPPPTEAMLDCSNMASQISRFASRTSLAELTPLHPPPTCSRFSLLCFDSLLMVTFRRLFSSSSSPFPLKTSLLHLTNPANFCLC